MAKINRDWHAANRMPARASEAERAAWHYQHALHCGCREITPSIAELLAGQGYPVPQPHSDTNDARH